MSEAPDTQQIWNLLHGKLSGFIRSRVADEQAAADILQETFLRVHENLDSVEDERRLAAWVFQIARRLVVDHYRASGGRRRREQPLEADPAVEESQENLNEEVAGWVPAMIETLPEKYREAVRLYELEGIPQQEIADRLGLSLSGAKSRIQRGRALFKQRLHDCCVFDLDRQGNIIEFRRRAEQGCCSRCGDGGRPRS